ncbi:MAG TPA: hypothetical protein VF957_16695 [Bradyrhizobium sp.]
MQNEGEQHSAEPNPEIRIDLLEARLDELLADRKPKTPWFKEPSLIISIAAFFISVVTTTTSEYRTYRQGVEAQKAQLRTLVLQLNSGSLQAVELAAKYKGDPSLVTISSVLNVQNTLAAKQAYQLVKAIGKDATSMDFGIVAYALGTAGELLLGQELGLVALNRATNATDYLGATRALGTFKMTTRQTAEAEVYFKKALNVFDIYPNDVINEQNVQTTHAWTQLDWASSSPDCTTAMPHIAEANKYLDSLGKAAQPGMLQWRDQFVSFCVGPQAPQLAVAPPSLGVGK